MIKHQIRATLVDRLILVFCKLLSRMRRLPLMLLAPFFALIAMFVGMFCRRERRIASLQVELALYGGLSQTRQGTSRILPSFFHPAMRRAEIFLTVMGSFAHVGYALGEVLKWQQIVCKEQIRPKTSVLSVAADSPSQLSLNSFPSIIQLNRVRLVGANIADYLIETNRGCIALAAHTGNFELLAATFARMGSKLTVVARTPKYPELHNLFNQIRHEYGMTLLWREDVAIARKLMSALQQGNIVALLIDQDTNLPNSFSDFFGLKAATPISPVRLALRAKVPLFTSFIYRTGWMSHEILVEEICGLETPTLGEAEILSIYNARLEKIIRAHPMQWPWWHKRWRRRPDIDYDKNPEALLRTAQYLAWLENEVSLQHQLHKRVNA